MYFALSNTVFYSHILHDSVCAAGLPDPREDPVVEQVVEGGLKTVLIRN